MPGTTVAASEAPSVSLSCMETFSRSSKAGILTGCVVANNFWGKEDAGVTPLLTRMQNAKTTGDELRAYYLSLIHI